MGKPPGRDSVDLESSGIESPELENDVHVHLQRVCSLMNPMREGVRERNTNTIDIKLP